MSIGFDQVSTQFTLAREFADEAGENAQELVEQLLQMASAYAPPSIVDPTTLPTLPPGPVASEFSELIPVTFNTVTRPADNLVAPEIEAVLLDDLPAPPAFDPVDIPPLNFPAGPVAPVVDTAIETVEAPNIAEFEAPGLVDIVVPAPIAVTLPTPPDFIDTTQRLTPPAAYTYTPGEQYGSALLEALKTTLRSRMDGSTGLPDAVEQALWDRARSRELNTTLGNQTEVMRSAEARGLPLPSGALVAQLREAQRDYFGRVSELSRDIAIKQAELEQANARAAIEQGIQLETRLIDYANQIEQRTFEAARLLAENAVAIYNAQVTEVRSLTDAFAANATIYRARADVEISRVEVYRAQIQAESLKTEINRSRVEQFRALIESAQSRVALYTARVNAQRTLIEIEQSKVALFGEQVRAYSAQIQAEVARLDGPKVQAEVNQSRAAVYRAQVEAYAAEAEVRNQNARNQIDIYESRVRALQAQFQGYSTEVQAEAERVRAIASVNDNLIERDRATIQRDTAQYQQSSELFRAQVALYQTQTAANADRTRLASDHYLALRTLASEAAKVGAQVNAQLAASAFSTIQANAGISTGLDVNFNYSGETNGSASPA